MKTQLIFICVSDMNVGTLTCWVSSPDFSFNICQNKLMKWIILVLFPLRVNYSQFLLLHGGL